MSNLKRLFVNGRYGQVHARVSGPKTATRRPLVCLHMFPQSGRNFEYFIEAASEDRLVVAPDFPGYGESSSPPHPISAEDYASAMWDAIDALELCKVHGQIDIFGIHAGAKLAVELANQRPGSVNRIALSSAAVLDKSEIERLKGIFSPIKLDEDGSRFKHLWRLLVDNRGPEMSLEMCATSFAEMLRGGEGYEWGHMAVFEHNYKFADVLTKIQHPVALLNPGDELYKYTPRSAEFLPNCTLIDLPNWTHGYLEAHAEAAADIITDWMDGTYKKAAE